MTGYGKSEAVFGNKKIIVEIKSLNSKNFDITTKVAPAYTGWEMQLRQLVSASAVRGKIDLFIKVEEPETAAAATVNKDVVASYVSQIKEISAQLGISEPHDWWEVIGRMPGVTQSLAAADVSEAERQVVFGALKEALDNFVEFRRQEGNAVTLKFKEKIANIGQYLKEIETYEQQRVEKIRGEIVDKLGSLPVDYDRNRLEQEMIYYIEKLDINEEKQRLANHLKYFSETMESDEPQGKKLGFIAQEMGREINTMGSKSNQADMQNIVVKMKDELEQIKEQVLNVL
jgi:uncharacterized protein (TIGR00255 family)